jgi:hypothetical protein
MDLWVARNDSQVYLREYCVEQVVVLEEILKAIDLCIDCFEQGSEGSYARVCGLTLLKAKNLGVGTYSLILDGLAQEAGALMRPFIEYTELLTYFRTFPGMVDKAIGNDLPSAGDRAKAVEGIYHNFRKHLNSHASHSSYSHFSLSHLHEPQTLKFRKLQRSVPLVLERNLRDLVIQVYLLLREAVLCLENVDPSAFDLYAGNVDMLTTRLINTFKLNDV